MVDHMTDSDETASHLDTEQLLSEERAESATDAGTAADTPLDSVEPFGGATAPEAAEEPMPDE